MAKYDVTKATQDNIIKALEKELDTRDKRYMFLRLEFSDLLSRIVIEGSAFECAWNIYKYFEKSNMLGSLTATLNSCFDLDIEFESHD